MDWQDISTAPKDGSYVLLLEEGHKDDYPTRIIIAFWGDKLAGYAEDNPENYAWLDWHRGFEYTNDGALWFAVRNPTHWMPLPPPPTEAP